jgi:hypothetical protein
MPVDAQRRKFAPQCQVIDWLIDYSLFPPIVKIEDFMQQN